MSPRLNQIIAVEKGAKAQSEAAMTAAYHSLQKADLFDGIIRSYEPLNDGDEVLPGEQKKVITTVRSLLDNFTDQLSRLMDVTATKIQANTKARADVEVDGVVLFNAPVEYLLFLEKRLIDLMTFLSKAPTLDPAQDWHYDDAAECYATHPLESHRTQKQPRYQIMVPPTDKHPAQIREYDEEVYVGNWQKILLSGAVPAGQITLWKAKVAKLQAAVKMAREEANSIDVLNIEVGSIIMDHLFG